MELSKIDEQVEFNYHYMERLGMLCGNRLATEQERQMARADADEAVRKMKEQLEGKELSLT